jgi:hypothetical protein
MLSLPGRSISGVTRQSTRWSNMTILNDCCSRDRRVKPGDDGGVRGSFPEYVTYKFNFHFE